MERRPLERCSSNVADRSKNLNAAVSVGSDIAHHKRRTPDELPGSMEGVDQVMITDEPDGGSPQPTGRLLAVADLS